MRKSFHNRKHHKMKKTNFSMAMRIATVPPIMASLFLLCMFVRRMDVFSGIGQWLYYLVLLGLMPLLAYPLQSVLPHFRDKGRPGQRILAMLFAVSGYILCCVMNFIVQTSSDAWIIVLEYLMSGAVILLFNKGFRIKLSGHACGIVGPVALLFLFDLHAEATVGLLITAIVYVTSIKTKRHTLPQLIGGSIVPIVLIILLKLLLSMF